MCSSRKHRGSTLVMVVALLAVLFVLGMGFLAVTRVDRRSVQVAERQGAIDVQVDAVAEKVIAVLLKDLFGSDDKILNGDDGDEPFDRPGPDDPWLAEVFPEDPVYANNQPSSATWNQVTDLDGAENASNVEAVATRDAVSGKLASMTLRLPAWVAGKEAADTDLDGLPDAFWQLSPCGRYRYAVRIIDLCAMLNLNTGFGSELTFPGTTPAQVGVIYGNDETAITFTPEALPLNPERGVNAGYTSVSSGDGKLCLINRSSTFRDFGRGGYRVGSASSTTVYDWSLRADDPFVGRWTHATDTTIPNEAPLPFPISDTLALLSYGVKTGPTTARIDKAWPSLLATSGRCRLPNIRENQATPPAADSYRMYFTTFNAARQLRPNTRPTGSPPSAPGIASWEQWESLLNSYDTMLGAGSAGFNRVFINYSDPHNATFTRAVVAAIVLSGCVKPTNPDGLDPKQVEQLVVNLADWRDTDGHVSTASADVGANKVNTVWNSPDIYGNEPQVFITEIASRIYPDEDSGGGPGPSGKNCYAVELYNPYNKEIDLQGWKIAGEEINAKLPAGRYMVIRNKIEATDLSPGAEMRPWPIKIDELTESEKAKIVIVERSNMKFYKKASIDLERPMVAGEDPPTLVVVDRAASLPSGWSSPPEPEDPDGAGPEPEVTPLLCESRYCRGDFEWAWARDEWQGETREADTPQEEDGWSHADWKFGLHNGKKEFSEGMRGKLAAIPVPPGGALFRTLGELHYLMLVGPGKAGAAEADPVTAKITAQSSAAGIDSLFVDFTNSTRGDYKMLSRLIRLDRRLVDESFDWNGNGAKGGSDLSEISVPGLININTAPPHVLKCLSWYMLPAQTTSGHDTKKPGIADMHFNLQLYDYCRKKGAFESRVGEPGFRDGVGEVMKIEKMHDTTALLDMDFNGLTGGQAYNPRNIRADVLTCYQKEDPAPQAYRAAVQQDLTERHFIFDRISDLMTTRSDTFLAYILVQELPPNGTVNQLPAAPVLAERRVVMIFDRSMCNVAPNQTGFVKPRIVARNRATWVTEPR